MTNNEIAFTVQQIDGAYINSLVDLVNACRDYQIKIDKVYHFQNGWRVTFAGHPHADAICHDWSYGSPCYMAGYLGKGHDNDWSRSGSWETIGFPWDDEDVSVHSAYALAAMIAALNRGDNWEEWEDCEGC